MFKTSIQFIITLVITLIVFLGVGYAHPEPVLLEGELMLTPDTILPGTEVTFTFNVKNISTAPSPKGEILVRYALIQPLSNATKNAIFSTEKKMLPSIDPGKTISVVFNTPQKLPSVIDFVRDDWLLYEYQVIYISDDKESVILTMPLTLSAHYYPVFRNEHSLIELSR